jgi:hypothetical protein
MVIVFLMLCSAFAFAQAETGSISGAVTDPSGAILPGATVTLTRVDTGQARTETTGNNGAFTFTNLQPGNYEVVVSAGGFNEFRKPVQVSVGSRNTVDAALTVTGGATTVEVTTQAGAEVNTQDQQLSQVVTGTQVTQLPTITRNPYDLVGIAGNVAPDPLGDASRGAGFSINGQRAAGTDILLDGAENVDLFTADVGQTVPLDSVQEFRVQTGNFTAEYGRASGGVVNVATKSGTNAFHGSLYEFNRISEFTSNTYQNNATGVPKPRFVRNQFGYSLGGPIIKDKIFFFSSTEWIRVRSQLVEQAYIPTPEFLAASAAATQAFFTQFGALGPTTQRTGTFVRAGDFSVTGVAPNFSALPPTLPLFELVNYRITGNAGGGDPQDAYTTVNRLDFNFTPNTQLYARYALDSNRHFAGTNTFSPYAGYDTGFRNHNHNALLNLTHVFGPNLVSQSKFTYNRLVNVQPLGPNPVGPTLYAQPTTAFSVPGTGINTAFPGYNPFGPGTAIPFGGPQNLYQAYQDLSWNRGKHQFRFGGQYIHTRDNRTFGAFQTAVEALGSQGRFLSGNASGTILPGIENFLTGNLRQFQVAIDPQGKFPCHVDQAVGLPIQTPDCTVALPVSPPLFNRNNRYNDFAVYLQDSWKAHPRLTLNLGVRWEYYGVQHNANENLDSNFYFGPGATEAEQIRNGAVMIAPQSPVGRLWNPDWNNVAPRVGFAWDVRGDGRTSLRGGYGISYERNFGNVTFNVIQNPPAYLTLNLIAGPGQDVPSLPLSTSNFGALGTAGTAPLLRASTRWVDQNIVSAYAHMYSLAVEHQFAPNTVFAIEFSGSRGVHQYTLEDPNRPGSGVIYGGDDPTINPLSRLNDQYSALNRRSDAASSSYNGVNLSLRSNNFRNYGLTLTANYTWSHAIDILSSTFSESQQNFNLGLLDPFNAQLDRGDADFDVRHRIAFSAVYETPFFKNASGWKRQALGGWSFAPIFTARTGFPFTLFDCAFGNQACSRPIFDQGVTVRHGATGDVGPDLGQNTFNYLVLPPNSFTSWFNPLTETADFGNCTVPGQGATAACPYPLGMDRRNAYRHPGFWNLDLGVYKTFQVTERVGLQLRAEAYNLFNHSNLYVDPASLDVESASVNGGTGDPGIVTAVKGRAGLLGGTGAAFDERRNLQLGVKITF